MKSFFEKISPNGEKDFFVSRTPKVSLAGIALRAKSLFSHTSVEKFYVCGKLKQNINFTALVR